MFEITWLGHGTFQLRLDSGEVFVLDAAYEEMSSAIVEAVIEAIGAGGGFPGATCPSSLSQTS